jgi:group I intron endonuclease
MEKQAGVYEIEIAGYKYYGSSIDIYARKRNHIAKLRSGKHRNQRLQRCFDKYGEDAIAFKTLVLCDKESVLDEEQKYLDKNIGKDNCLNFCKSASAPMAGIKFSDNHKKKMSDAQVRNKYIFYYECGKVESFDSLKLAGNRFDVKAAIVSKWFKRKDLGRKHGILRSSRIIKAEKIGDENIILLPWQYKQEPWIVAGATSRNNYYKEKRNEIKTHNRQSVS